MHLLNSMAQLRKYSDDKYIDCDTTYKDSILCSYFLRQYTALKVFSLSNKCMNISDQNNARGAIQKLVNILTNHVDIEIMKQLSELNLLYGSTKESLEAQRHPIISFFLFMYLLYKLYLWICRIR